MPALGRQEAPNPVTGNTMEPSRSNDARMGTRQGWILGGGVMLVLAGAALAMGPAGRASGQSSAAVISIAPPSQQMSSTSGQFNIEIHVENVQNLGAFEV